MHPGGVVVVDPADDRPSGLGPGCETTTMHELSLERCPEGLGDGKALARWCRKQKMRIEFIEQGSPWQNGFCETYNGRMREELLNLELIENALEAQVLIDDWRHEFKTLRPHRFLRMQTPSEFAAHWRAEHGDR